MSSFIGHGLIAVGLSAFNDSEGHTIKSPPVWLWWGWLLILTWLPDIDYLLPFLRQDGVRYTHSFAFCLIFPMLTILALTRLGLPKLTFRLYCTQVIIAGLSHICLDVLVGVTTHPLLYPLTATGYELPFGLLPSAGYLHPTNPLLWRNFLMEIGILAPTVLYLHLWKRRVQLLDVAFISILLDVSIVCVIWAYSLPRY